MATSIKISLALVPSADLKPFETFLQTQRQAVNESQVREAFIALAATGFSDAEIATAMALGAEYQVHFRSAGAIRRGAIDSYFGNLVIEFEHDLTKTGAHALEQLRGYVAGAWREDGSASRPYLAVASDGLRWATFAPTLTDQSSVIDTDNIELKPTEALTVPTGAEGPGVLRDFLNRLLFRRFLLKPTASNFARDFGLTSPTFLKVVERLGQKLDELGSDPQLEVLKSAWADSLQIAYGGPVAENELFLRHTYLVVLARLLVWTSIEHRHLDPGELNDVLTGNYFLAHHVGNLVEDDYFKWYGIPSLTSSDPSWIAMSRQLAGYDLSTVDEDILKPLYEQLVDPAMRHDLGEYYTPDWLATLVTHHLLDGWDWSQPSCPRLLDPACGSGTFLRVAIDELRSKLAEQPGTESLDNVLSSIVGMDVHPLAVTIARATYLLAIRDLLTQASEAVSLPVYLADSLQMPPMAESPTLFGEDVELRVADILYSVPLELVRDSTLFDVCISTVATVARSYGEPASRIEDARTSLIASLMPSLATFGRASEALDSFGAMAEQIARLIRERRDSIYGFLLRNQMRPAMLRQQFDFVVGNPPWLTVNDVVVPHYKQRLVELATRSKIASRATGEQGHTDIATIMLAWAASDYLRPKSAAAGPRIGLVMPRSVFTASQHRALRQGTYTVPFVVTHLWDLADVTPLFNIPACVVFATLGLPGKSASLKSGRAFSGHLRSRDVPWGIAAATVGWRDVQYELAFLGKRSAWRVRDESLASVVLSKPLVRNAYLHRFRQGAVLYPQTLLVVRPHTPVANRQGVVVVHTDKDAASTAKRLRDFDVNCPIEAANLYTTAAADHVLPFVAAPNLWRIILPTLVDPGNRAFAPVTAHDLRRAGRIHTADWLAKAEEQWAQVRKPGDASVWSARLDSLGHLSAQRTMRRFVVVYIAAGSRPVACVIDRTELVHPFIARDGTYWTSTDDVSEAHFLSAFLNSTYAAESIRAWMTLGLFGPRHIHKRVLDVPWPEYDAGDDDHRCVSDLARSLHSQALSEMTALPATGSGRQRSWLRDRLSHLEQAEAEVLVASISSDATRL